MRKLLVLVLISLCFILSSCTSGKIDDTVVSNKTEIFQVSDYPIWVTTPSGWTESETENLDLQCLSPKGDLYLSTYGFAKIDLSEDQSAESLFESQNNMILSLRDNVSEVEPITIEDHEEKSIYSVLYSGEQDGVKNYYEFFFIHFKNTDDMVWILFTGIPSVIEKNREVIDNIIVKVQNSEPEQR